MLFSIFDLLLQLNISFIFLLPLSIIHSSLSKESKTQTVKSFRMSITYSPQDWSSFKKLFLKCHILHPLSSHLHLIVRHTLQKIQKYFNFSIPNLIIEYCLFVCFWRNSPQWVRAPSFTRFLDHTQRRTTVGRTPLDGWSARRRDLYLTTHNNQNRKTSMTPVRFEPIVSADEWPQTYVLEREAIGTGACVFRVIQFGWDARRSDLW